MDTTIITSIIALSGAIYGYVYTKQKEREAELRKEKLAYYKAFIESFNGAIDGESSPEGHKAFTKATNNLLLFAPQTVITALNEYRQEIRISNPNRSVEEQYRLFNLLILAIRRDVGVVPKDDLNSFKAILWASGVNKNGS